MSDYERSARESIRELTDALRWAVGRAEPVKWNGFWWECGFCGNHARGPGLIQHAQNCPEAVLARTVEGP